MATISFPLLVVSGLTAYILSSWLLVVLRALRLTAFSPRIYWTCFLFGSLRGIALSAGRIARALGMSTLIPLLYAVLFELSGNAELIQGAIIGTAHGVIVGAALPFLARRDRCAQAPAPGLFGWRLGKATPLLLLLIYAVYGATLGWAYVVVAP